MAGCGSYCCRRIVDWAGAAVTRCPPGPVSERPACGPVVIADRRTPPPPTLAAAGPMRVGEGVGGIA